MVEKCITKWPYTVAPVYCGSLQCENAAGTLGLPSFGQASRRGWPTP